jgi:hypothetical protein
MSEFEKSGITQAMLAARMGKNADVISRLLSRPQNWESDTFSAMLFAISGAVPAYSLEYPLRKQEPIDFKSENTTSQKVVKLDNYRAREQQQSDFRQVRTG